MHSPEHTGVKIHWGVFQLQGAAHTLNLLHQLVVCAQTELFRNGGSPEHIRICKYEVDFYLG